MMFYANGTDFILTNPNAILQSVATAQGDLLYATGENTVEKLAKGTAFQALRMNSGETAPEWGALTAEGTFTDFTTTIVTGTNTFTIPLGMNANFGHVKIWHSSEIITDIIINKNTNGSVGIEMYYGGASIAGKSLGYYGIYSSSGETFFSKCYIDGSDLKIELEATTGSGNAQLTAYWRVWV